MNIQHYHMNIQLTDMFSVITSASAYYFFQYILKTITLTDHPTNKGSMQILHSSSSILRQYKNLISTIAI